MRTLLFGLVAFAMVISINGGGLSALIPFPMALDGPIHSPECNFCKGPVCRIPTPDCRVFITCEKAGSRPNLDGTSSDIYTAKDSLCAFGTFFNENSGVCDLPENVQCATDRCRIDSTLSSYPHDLDDNCRTYYNCSDLRISTPTCCPLESRYDAQAGGCVPDPSCTPGCPTKADACSTPGVEKALSDDNNCRTYWDCLDGGSPHPVCCPPNQSFDPVLGDCLADAACTAECPKSYERRCQEAGVASYKLVGPSCRTYVKCVDGGREERWCCKSGYRFDDQLQSCQQIGPNELVDCLDDCPYSYKEECPLLPVPGSDRSFVQKVGAMEITRECAPGSAFSVELCGCGTHLKDPADNSCNLALNMVMNFPNTIRTGDQRFSSLSATGKPNRGSLRLDAMSFALDGSYGIGLEITKMRLKELFLNVQFKPSEGPAGKSILISNCRQQTSVDPTFEVALQGANIVVTAVTDRGIATASVPVVRNEWNSLYVTHDGQTLRVLVQNPLNAPAKSVELPGQIKMALYPLQVGKCDEGAGFVGEIHSLSWSPCLRETFLPLPAV